MYNYFYSLLVLFVVIKNLNIYTLQDNPIRIHQKLNDQSHTIEQAENDTSTSSSSLLTLSSSLSSSMSTPEPLKGKLTSEKGTTKAPKLVSRSKNGHPEQTPKAAKLLVQKRRLNASSTRNPSAKKAKRDSVENEHPPVPFMPNTPTTLVRYCSVNFYPL